MQDMSGARVSIVIPTYNGEAYIRETFQSCLDQTYKNLEILICDDASRDTTIEIVKTMAAGQSHVNLIELTENRGMAKNVNMCARQATGTFMIILGHDDILPPDHVEKMVAWFEPDVAVVHCNAQKIDSKGAYLDLAYKNEDDMRKKTANPLRYLCINNVFQSCGMMLRREAFLSIGGWDERFISGEYFSYVQFAEHWRFRFADNTKAFYRVHPTNMTKSLNTERAKSFDAYLRRCRALAMEKADLTLLETLNLKFKMARRDLRKRLRKIA